MCEEETSRRGDARLEAIDGRCGRWRSRRTKGGRRRPKDEAIDLVDRGDYGKRGGGFLFCVRQGTRRTMGRTNDVPTDHHRRRLLI